MNSPIVSTTPLFEVPIFRLGMAKTHETCEKRLAEGHGGYVCFVNVHSLTESTTHSALQTTLQGSFLALPDGVPLVWASKVLKPEGESVVERVCGPDFMTETLTRNPGKTFGFIGGLPGQAEAIASRFGIRAIAYSPPFRAFSRENAVQDWKAFRSVAAKSGEVPRWIWVCLGAPKQELWMNAVSASAPDTLFFGVGAAFDFLAGQKKRAPRWMQKMGLEWLFRLCQEPDRLWKRYLSTNTRFVARVIRERLKA